MKLVIGKPDESEVVLAEESGGVLEAKSQSLR